MCQISKIIQHDYSTVASLQLATIRTDVAKILLFYIPFSLSSLFIFSFLFSLTLRFPLSSTSPGCSLAATTA